MRQLGIIYERGDDWTRAETWYREAADAGDGEAKTRLADLQRRRAGIPPTPQAAPDTSRNTVPDPTPDPGPSPTPDPTPDPARDSVSDSAPLD